MAPLFGELEPRDAAAVVASLERQRIPYRIAGGGTQVLAPADQAPRLRLLLAKEGLPSGGGVGWEIFDRGESLTTAPFQQDVNRLRALEGELARTIRGLAGVRAARVHLVLPRREAFSRERGEAQASVVLSMQGVQRLDPEGVQAVLHLVATAVPGLKPQGISIVDSRGALLARGGQALAGQAVSQGQEEIRRAQELRLGRAVEGMLERSLGPGRVRAEATIEMDFDRVETKEERFDPENQVARSQQSSTEQNRGAEPAPTTVAGNLPGTDPGPAPPAHRRTGRRRRRTTRSAPLHPEHPARPSGGQAPLGRGAGRRGDGGRAAALARARARGTGPHRRLGAQRRRVRRQARRQGRSRLDALRRGTGIRRGGVRLPRPAAVAGARHAAGRKRAAGPGGAGRHPAGRPADGRTDRRQPGAGRGAGRPGRGPRRRRALANGTLANGALPGGADEMAALSGAAGGNATLLPNGDPTLPGTEENMVSLAHVQGQMRASSLNALSQMVQRHPDESLAVLRRWLDPEDRL